MANKERLLKLAEHLLHGKLGHKEFDFTQWNSGWDPICGTKGCAIGECPVVFTEDWKFNSYGNPTLIDLTGRSYYPELNIPTVSGMIFFNLSKEEFQSLFIEGGDEITTKEDVANNIIKFCSTL